MKTLTRLLVLSTITLSITACDDYSRVESNDKKIIEQTNPNKRNDKWGFVGPGGGGAMFNPAINPSDPNHAFVSCDMTGSFVTYNGGANWRMFNLRGVVRFYAFDPLDSKVVYAGTSNVLYKSFDQGNSWEAVYPKPADILAVIAKGDHADEVVITKDGIRKSIKKLVVDPVKPERLYLLVQLNRTSENNGGVQENSTVLLVSNNYGTSWRKESELEIEADNIFIDPLSSMDDRSIYLTGKTFIKVRKNGIWSDINLPEGAGSTTQFVDGWDKKNNQYLLYVLSGKSYFNRQGKEDNSGIYKTTDGGKSWSSLGENFKLHKMDGGEEPEFRSMAACYFQPNNIYVSYANLRIHQDTISIGVARSKDFGKTWDLVWNDENDKSSLNRESGWLDQRFGPGWGENPFHIKVADNNPDIVYTTDFGRTIKSGDGGKSWDQLYTDKAEGGGWKSRGLQVTTGYMISFDPFDSLHIFLADTDTGLMESVDGGVSWSSATYDNGVPDRWVNSTYWMIFDPLKEGRVWAVMSRNHDLPRPKMWRNRNMEDYEGGVLISDDSGKTWKAISEDIGEAATTYIILDLDSDVESRTLYVCAFGKGVYKSTDGGLTWKQKNNGIAGEQPATWRITRKNTGELFLIVFRKSDDGSIGNELDGALYRSIDGAESWTKTKLPDNVNGPSSLTLDNQNPNRLLLSAWGRPSVEPLSGDIGGGIYISDDNGESWIPVLDSDQHIHDITYDSQSGVFYAAGFNSSIYRSDDKGSSWSRIKGYNFKWGKRVQPDPNDSDKIYVITFGGGVWHGPAHGDENALEDIITPQLAYNKETVKSQTSK
jgi:photosystem II stability/assembly factor-like uncharacterized protein